ncbi:protein kinase [Micromonospora sp. M12]
MTAGPPDPASDVYALGALLYRTLTGRAPLPVQSWEDALEVHRQGTPVPPLRVPGLPADIAELTVACLAANPADRPSAAHLARRFGAGQPVEPPTELLRIRPVAHPPTLIDRSAVRPARLPPHRPAADRVGPSPCWSRPAWPLWSAPASCSPRIHSVTRAHPDPPRSPAHRRPPRRRRPHPRPNPRRQRRRHRRPLHPRQQRATDRRAAGADQLPRGEQRVRDSPRKGCGPR